jgi:hypothetical protein
VRTGSSATISSGTVEGGISVGGGTLTIAVGANVTIPASRNLTVDGGGTVSNNAAITVNGNINVVSSSIFTNNGTIANNGYIYIYSTIANSGTITNNGAVINSSGLIIMETGGTSNGAYPLNILTFDANGGTGSFTVAEPTTTVNFAKFAAYKPIRTGFTLVGWHSTPTGADPYINISEPSYAFTNGGTVYAQWAQPPVITTTSPLPSCYVGDTYSQTLTATGGGIITWSLDTGALPAGLLLNASTGAITGTPTAAGVYTFTVKAGNGVLPDATKTFSLTTPRSVPAFINLKNTYALGDFPVNITVFGKDSDKLTTIRVTKEKEAVTSGAIPLNFTPADTGLYLVEALSADESLRIWKYVTVTP